MKNCACIVGNSSSAIREGSFIGTPAVNIGTRQNNRLRGKNVIDVKNEANKISESVLKQLNKGNYRSENMYGDGNSSKKIIKILRKIKKIEIEKINSF